MADKNEKAARKNVAAYAAYRSGGGKKQIKANEKALKAADRRNKK
ncbi:MAG TPA: hypothetical protein VFW64_12360 [Pseudonocardiaceae bacterium]|nr:hypothetical protein [Pseudonocardiaceae bacterium]